MTPLSVVLFSTGQKRLLKKTLKHLRRNVDFSSLKVRWLISDDYVSHPRINNEECRTFIRETGLFDYCYFPDTNQGYSNVVNHMYRQVDTPFLFHMEYDWKFVSKVTLRPLLEVMEAHEEIACIRFNKKITKAAPVVFWLDEPERERRIRDITLTQTKSWTFNPTVYRTADVRKALPLEGHNGEMSFKEKMGALGFQSYSLGRAGETYVKHLRGIGYDW